MSGSADPFRWFPRGSFLGVRTNRTSEALSLRDLDPTNEPVSNEDRRYRKPVLPLIVRKTDGFLAFTRRCLFEGMLRCYFAHPPFTATHDGSPNLSGKDTPVGVSYFQASPVEPGFSSGDLPSEGTEGYHNFRGSLAGTFSRRWSAVNLIGDMDTPSLEDPDSRYRKPEDLWPVFGMKWRPSVLETCLRSARSDDRARTLFRSHWDN